jgi:hypothetical protein
MAQLMDESRRQYKKRVFIEDQLTLGKMGCFRGKVEQALEDMDVIVAKLREDYKTEKSPRSDGLDQFDFYFCINGRVVKPKSFFEE